MKYSVSECEDEIEIKLSAAADLPWEERPWTGEELRAFMHFRGLPAKQIMLEGWEDQGITDSVAWVEEVRRKELRKW